MATAASNAMRALKQLLFVASTGYILVYFSELLFWARVRPDDTVLGWIGVWIVYTLLAYVVLALVASLRVHTIWALFLVGAGIGWLAERLVVQTTYAQLPWSLSWTALAWHALISVGIGWYGLGQALRAPRPWPSLGVATAIGLVYGVWAIGWWVDVDGGIASVAAFARYGVTTTLLLMLAYGVARWSGAAFAPDRRVLRALGAVALLYFAAVTVPAVPVALLILPLLLGGTWVGLRRNHRRAAPGSLLDGGARPIAGVNYASLLAIPVVSSGVYALATALSVRWATSWIVFGVTMPLGFGLYGLSWYKLWRAPAGEAAGTDPAPERGREAMTER